MLASFDLLGLVLAQPVDGWGRAWGGPPGLFPLFPLLPLVWLCAVGLVVWLVVRNGRRRDGSAAERARDILAERYARGELSSDEYRERFEHLRASGR